MRKIASLVVVGALAFAALGGVALAGQNDVIERGGCSGASDWKLKLSPEDGRLEVEFEVDQNVVGDTWRVVMGHNGERFFRGKRTTKAPSGSFEVRRVVEDLDGTDTIKARARNTSTDEVCVGRASI